MRQLFVGVAAAFVLLAVSPAQAETTVYCNVLMMDSSGQPRLALLTRGFYLETTISQTETEWRAYVKPAVDNAVSQFGPVGQIKYQCPYSDESLSEKNRLAERIFGMAKGRGMAVDWVDWRPGNARSGGNSGGSGKGAVIEIKPEPEQEPAPVPGDKERTVYMACTWKNRLVGGSGAVLNHSKIGSRTTTNERYSKEISAWDSKSADEFAATNPGKGAFWHCYTGDSEAAVKRQIDEIVKNHRELNFSIGYSSWSP